MSGRIDGSPPAKVIERAPPHFTALTNLDADGVSRGFPSVRKQNEQRRLHSDQVSQCTLSTPSRDKLPAHASSAELGAQPGQKFGLVIISQERLDRGRQGTQPHDHEGRCGGAEDSGPKGQSESEREP